MHTRVPIFAVKGTGNYVIGQGQAWGANYAPQSNILISAEGLRQTFNIPH